MNVTIVSVASRRGAKMSLTSSWSSSSSSSLIWRRIGKNNYKTSLMDARRRLLFSTTATTKSTRTTFSTATATTRFSSSVSDWDNQRTGSTSTRSKYFSTESSNALQPQGGDDDNNNNNLPSKLIDFDVSAKIEGQETQIATIQLRHGETLRAESGSMLFMTQGIEMDTNLQGVSKAFTRMMTGQNVFLTDFTYTGGHGDDGASSNNDGTSSYGEVALGTDFPSKIIKLSLNDYDDSTLVCQRGAYLASNPSVDIGMEVTKSLGVGFFGGQGFILQKLSGDGDVLLKAGGTLVEKELQPGETLRVTSGSIVAFTKSGIDYDIQMMPGIQNAMFGGEGLFITTLTGTGPYGGKVWLQGMPPERMIAEIARRVPGGGLGIGPMIGGGGVGGEGEGAEGDVDADGADDEGLSEQVAATDQAIDADRQATVASSGLDTTTAAADGADANSPSALYGDAAPEDSGGATTTSSTDPFSDDTFFKDDDNFNDGATATTFSTDDETTTFSTDDNFGSDSFGADSFGADSTSTSDGGNSGGFWSHDDSTTTTTDVFDSATGSASSEGVEDAVSEGGSSIISTLWDMFTGGDD